MRKRCNSNDANSMFEQAAGELRAKLMGSGGAWPDNESTRRAHISDTAPPVWRAPEGPEGQAAVPVGSGGAWQGFEATRRAKLAARTASGRAGRAAAGDPSGQQTTSRKTAAHGHTKQPGPPTHHTAPGTPAGPHSARQHNTPRRHNKTARPHWGRAAVAVALGFEPRVAVTPHSISSAAPSAARTRYLTRILYYILPPRAQIDRACWEQGHTAA